MRGLLVMLVLGLGGCGMKGDLYLVDESEPGGSRPAGQLQDQDDAPASRDSDARIDATPDNTIADPVDDAADATADSTANSAGDQGAEDSLPADPERKKIPREPDPTLSH